METLEQIDKDIEYLKKLKEREKLRIEVEELKKIGAEQYSHITAGGTIGSPDLGETYC